MKKFHPALRILAQLILCGPMLIYFPWAVIVGAGTIYFSIMGESAGFSKDFGFGLGWLGLIGLFATILIPAESFRNKRWVRLSATCLIACGFLAAIAILLDNDGSGYLITKWDWGRTWILGGPLIVGTWNFSRIWKKPTPPADDSAASGLLQSIDRTAKPDV